jgi:hypothetical protein
MEEKQVDQKREDLTYVECKAKEKRKDIDDVVVFDSEDTMLMVVDATHNCVFEEEECKEEEVRPCKKLKRVDYELVGTLPLPLGGTQEGDDEEGEVPDISDLRSQLKLLKQALGIMRASLQDKDIIIAKHDVDIASIRYQLAAAEVELRLFAPAAVFSPLYKKYVALDPAGDDDHSSISVDDTRECSAYRSRGRGGIGNSVRGRRSGRRGRRREVRGGADSSPPSTPAVGVTPADHESKSSPSSPPNMVPAEDAPAEKSGKSLPRPSSTSADGPLPTNARKSYASAAKSSHGDGNRPPGSKLSKSALCAMFRAPAPGSRAPAQTWHRKLIRLAMPERYRRLPRTALFRIVKEMFQAAGLLPRFIKAFSLIGRSVVEVYFAEAAAADISRLFAENEIVVEASPPSGRLLSLNNSLGRTASEIFQFSAQRIGFLLSRHSIVALRDCILEGFSPAFQAEARRIEATFRLSYDGSSTSRNYTSARRDQE